MVKEIKIKNLMAQLSLLQYREEAAEIAQLWKRASLNDLQAWTEVLEEAEAPIPPDISERAVSYLVRGAFDFAASIKDISHLGAEEIKEILSVADQLYHLSGKAELNQTEIIKAAGIIEKGLKVVPYIGVIFSAALALKNLVYGIQEYALLIKDAEVIDLTWIDTLFPVKLHGKAQEFHDEPEKLKLLIKTIKSSKVFVDEGISLIYNSLDAVKDFIFLFLDFGSAGLLGFADAGISLIIAVLQWKSENVSAEEYDQVLVEVKENAEDQIQKLTPQADAEVNYGSMSMDELERLIATLPTL